MAVLEICGPLQERIIHDTKGKKTLCSFESCDFPLYRIAFAPPYWVSVHTQDSCGGAIPVTGVKVHLTDHNSGASHIGYEFLPYLVSYM